MSPTQENGANDDGDGPDRPRYGTYDYLRQFQHAPAKVPPNSEMIRDFDLSGAHAGSRARRSLGPTGYVRADRRVLEDVCERPLQSPAGGRALTHRQAAQPAATVRRMSTQLQILDRPGVPVGLPGQYQLHGEIAQTVELTLERGQTVWASKGSIVTHEAGIRWQLKVPGAAVSRMLSGEGLAMAYVSADRAGAKVVLGANETGKIAVWDLAQGPVTCTAGSFVGALGDVKIEVTVARRFGAAMFGGAGLLLQKISGHGLVFIHGAGDFLQRELNPGEALTISTGNLAAFSSQTDYDIVGVGGCIKMLFGREGLFMTRVSGPGKVLLQTQKRLRIKQGPYG